MQQVITPFHNSAAQSGAITLAFGKVDTLLPASQRFRVATDARQYILALFPQHEKFLMAAFLPGFLLGLSLILPIGAQNAFVLRQGLLRRHVWAVCLTCALSDAVLIMTGVAGFGALVAAVPRLETVMTLAGAAFLVVYAVRSFWAAFIHDAALQPAGVSAASLAATLATCLAFTWLNPHVYSCYA